MLYIRLSLCGLLLLCVDTWAQITSIRLAFGEASEPNRTGIVLVTYAGIEKTICNEAFDNNDATVICRDVGYDGFGLYLTGDKYADNLPANLYDQYWLTQLACTGDETTINDCSSLGLGVGLGNCEGPPGNTGHNGNYASVVCLGNPITTTTTTTTTTTVRTTTTPETVCQDPDPDIRLVDINGDVHSYQGRVQVRRNDTWYEICDDRWGVDDAKVVARMLCYNSNNARPHVGGSGFGNRTADSFLYNEVQCTGNEETIFACERTLDVADCNPQESAGVSVQDPVQPDLQIPVSVVVCDSAVEHIHVSFAKSDNPDLRPSHLSLADESIPDDCYTVGENSSEVYISIPFISCGTVRDFTNDTYIIYRNRIQHHITTTDTITRRQAYIIDVICLMGRNGDPENEVKPDEVTLPPVYGTGEPILELNLYESNSFRVKIATLPAQFLLGEYVYVAMELITTDPELKVILQQCYATPEVSPESTPQHFLIKDKCAMESTVIMYPLSDTKFGFTFQLFTFANVDHFLLYLHCKGIVCGLEEKYGRCDQTCGTGTGGRDSGRRRRSVDDDFSDFQFSALLDFNSERMRRQADFEPVEIDVDSGPIYILPPEQPMVTSTTQSAGDQMTTVRTTNSTASLRVVSTDSTARPGVVSTDSTARLGVVSTDSTARPGIMSTDSTARLGVVSTERTARESTTNHPQPTDHTTQTMRAVYVHEYPIASTATLIRITLSLLVSIVMALILS